MDKLIIYKKFSSLPENLKEEVIHFIDFLLYKNKNKPAPKRKFGSAKGKIKMHKNFDDPLEDFKDY
jgi:hypothetical protein